MKIRFRSKYLKEFVEEIQYKNRNPRDFKVLEMLDDISTNPERTLSEKTLLFRSRIISDESKINKQPNFFGFDKQGSFIPPVNATRDMRANYRYIPYLYCANHPYTALVEVRPRIGALVSVATIEVISPIRLLDFTRQNISKRMSPAKINFFADLSALYSKPIANDDDVLDYIPTQFIAEYVKNLGYDGIAFRSSLTPELTDQDAWDYPDDLDRYNAVIFNYDKCAPIKSNVVEISHNYTECRQVDEDPKEFIIKTSLLDKRY